MQRSMQLLMRALVAAVVVAALPLLSAPAANAQGQAPSQAPSPGPSQQQGQDIPDQKLDAAAVALEQVANVREEYRQKLEQAPAQDAQTIADEAKGAIMRAITDQGLSVEEYTSILIVAQNNPTVREKIIKRIRPSEK
jgi:hypothetical protein